MSRTFLLGVSIFALITCAPIWLLGWGMSGGNWIVALLGLPIVGLPILGVALVLRDDWRARLGSEKQERKRA